MNKMRKDLIHFINEIYCDPLNDMGDGCQTEPDEFSRLAIYISAYDEGKIVGSVRFILGPNKPLSSILGSDPTKLIRDTLNDLAPANKSNPELSRLVVAPNILGENSVLTSLVTELSKLALEYQHDRVAAAFPVSTYLYLTSLGIQFRLICPKAFFNLGQLHYWVTFQPSQVILQVRENEQPQQKKSGSAARFRQFQNTAEQGPFRNQFLMKRLYPEKRRHALEKHENYLWRNR